MPSTLSKVSCGCGGWWLKGILGFRFGPNLGLETKARTKLNNIAPSYFGLKSLHEFKYFFILGLQTLGKTILV